MIKEPKKTKYRKAHKGRVKTTCKAGYSLAYGVYGLKALQGVRITGRQIEAARRAAVRHMKRQGKFWIKVFADIPVSKKPAEVRMGKGKGSRDHYMFRVSPGRILFEIDGVKRDIALKAFELASAKLSIKSKVVYNIESEYFNS